MLSTSLKMAYLRKQTRPAPKDARALPAELAPVVAWEIQRENKVTRQALIPQSGLRRENTTDEDFMTTLESR